ncbi:MAG: DNA polymerase/3'-5' exonuclease PolX [Gemmatimonadaceae bacterium]
MDSRTAAHVLAQIAALLELRGENPFKVRAYQAAARALTTIAADDLAPLLRSGDLANLRGLGPATLAVVQDLVDTGESRLFDALRQATPEGLLDLMRVPGLGTEKILTLHRELGISSLEELELAARDKRLSRIKGLGPKSTQKILAGIAFLRDAGTLTLHPNAAAQANGLLATVRAHPQVTRAEIAGSLRRLREVVADVDIVAQCDRDPVAVAQSFAHGPGLRSSTGSGASVALRFMDGAKLDLHCVAPDAFPVALWRATGSAEHVAAVSDRLRQRGVRLSDDALVDASDRPIPVPEEHALYAAAELAWVPPELREARGEVEAAAAGTLPRLIEPSDLRGVLHCHSLYSDGKATIAEMAEGARERGWSYLGISDHSQAAFYASGVSREDMLAQHDEIDALNATLKGFRVLKGVEADILADGRLDYDAELLGRFDYVIASIHSRFQMEGAAMTERVLHAMDDPHMTILAHPTGRLLLSRAPYALDVDAVLEKAAAVGVAVEVNADPHRLDLDWRHLQRAKTLGVQVAIGPDAHSRAALAWTDLGVSMARKGWLEAGDVLNTRDASGVTAFARRRRA